MDELKMQEIQKGFYFPICNSEEIERIFNVKNTADYLLSLRANTVVDNMRLFRVYRNYAIMNEGTNWTFENSFSTSHFENFLELLDDDEKKKCINLTYGNIFSNDANGKIFKTEYGIILTISDALKYFLRFSHLALMNFGDTVPQHVKLNSLRIAIRVMLKTETLDFLMDPRGILPKDIAIAIAEPVEYQLQFIAGHEFAHYLLGHLDNDSVTQKPLYYAISDKDSDYGEVKVYNQSQKDEFEADLYSLKVNEKLGDEYKDFFEAALLWFSALELFETVCNLIYPRNPWDYNTHPTPKERYMSILDNATLPKDFNIEDWRANWSYIDLLKESVTEDVNNNLDLYEFYGSVYFDEPNTEWRGRQLVDRVDYY